MESNASFSFKIPLNTSKTAPMHATIYIGIPITLSKSIARIVTTMMIIAIFSFIGLNFADFLPVCLPSTNVLLSISGINLYPTNVIYKIDTTSNGILAIVKSQI